MLFSALIAVWLLIIVLLFRLRIHPRDTWPVTLLYGVIGFLVMLLVQGQLPYRTAAAEEFFSWLFDDMLASGAGVVSQDWADAVIRFHDWLENEFLPEQLPGLQKGPGLTLLMNMVLVTLYAVMSFLLTALSGLTALISKLLRELAGGWRAISEKKAVRSELKEAAPEPSAEPGPATRMVDSGTASFIANASFLIIIVAVLLAAPVFLAAYQASLQAEPLASAGVQILKVADGTSAVVWAAPFVLCAELCFAFRPPQLLARPAWLSDEASSTPTKPLEPLFEKYKEMFEDDGAAEDVMIAREDQPRPRVASSQFSGRSADNARARRLLQQLERSTDDASAHLLVDALKGFERGQHRLLVEGSLSEGHFFFLATLLQINQDKGGSVLIVAPDDAMSTVDDDGAVGDRDDSGRPQDTLHALETNLKIGLGRSYARVTQRWGRLDRIRDDGVDAYHNVLLGSERHLHDAFRQAPNALRKALERVTLIVIVDYHRLELALMRLQLARIGRAIDLKRVSVFCQSARRQGLHDNVDNLFGFHFALLNYQPRHFGRRFWLLWRDGPAAVRKVLSWALGPKSGEGRAGDAPQELLPVAMAPAWVEGYETALYDPETRTTRRDWRFNWQRRLDNDAIPEVRNKRIDLLAQAPRTLTTAGPAGRVVFMEDAGNLADAVDRELDVRVGGSDVERESMVQIIAHRYPLRDYLLDRVGRREAGVASLEALLPIAAKPGVGVAQLAAIVLDELRLRRPPAVGGLVGAGIGAARNELTQNELELLMRELSEESQSEMLRQLGVSPSPRGLNNLIRLSFGDAPQQITRRLNARHEYVYSLTAPHRRDGDDPFLCPIFFGARRQLVSWAQQGDEGLLWAQDGPLILRGREFVVSSVERVEGNPGMMRSVTVASQAAANWGLRSRPLSSFVRSYAPKSDQMAREAVPEWLGDRRGLALAHFDFERRTDGYYLLDHSHPPFANGGRAELLSAGRVVSQPADMARRRLQPALLVRYRLGATSSGGSRSASLPPKVRGQLAFTLAATLQDYLHSAFPTEGPRVAVVSPQAGDFAKELRQSNGQDQELERFISGVYPAFDLEAFDLESWMAMAREIFEQTEDTAPRSPAWIDLLVLEDAALDLGVARALRALWQSAEANWVDYLSWLAERAGDKDSYYGFGAGAAAEMFQFDKAAKLVRGELSNA